MFNVGGKRMGQIFIRALANFIAGSGNIQAGQIHPVTGVKIHRRLRIIVKKMIAARPVIAGRIENSIWIAHLLQINVAIGRVQAPTACNQTQRNIIARRFQCSGRR